MPMLCIFSRFCFRILSSKRINEEECENWLQPIGERVDRWISVAVDCVCSQTADCATGHSTWHLHPSRPIATVTARHEVRALEQHGGTRHHRRLLAANKTNTGQPITVLHFRSSDLPLNGWVLHNMKRFVRWIFVVLTVFTQNVQKMLPHAPWEILHAPKTLSGKIES